MKYITTDKAALAIGHYSQAIVANGFVFCAGQIGIDPKTDQLEPTEDLINGDSEILKSIASSTKEWSRDWTALWENIILSMPGKILIHSELVKIFIMD